MTGSFLQKNCFHCEKSSLHYETRLFITDNKETYVFIILYHNTLLDEPGLRTTVLLNLLKSCNSRASSALPIHPDVQIRSKNWRAKSCSLYWHRKENQLWLTLTIVAGKFVLNVNSIHLIVERLKGEGRKFGITLNPPASSA
jgi:hypothetical protein